MPVKGLTKGSLLAGNTFWNLVGTAFPLLVAIFCIPLLKRSLGTDRLGVISLAWVVIGYFGFFDLGLSRALTKLVAEKLGQARHDEIPPLIWTSLALMSAMGLIGTALALLLAPWMVERLLKVPHEIFGETLSAFYWIGCSIPMVVATAGLRGVLEALQKFRLATAIRVPMGVFSYLGPVLVLPFSHSLVAVMMVLVAGRLLGALAHLWACFYVMPDLRHSIGFHRAYARPLLSFGGWMTITNLVGPLMVTFDRIVVGALISVAAVAYYSIPYEVVTKLWIIPMALVGVLFPAFSATAESDRSRLVFLYDCGLKYLFLVLFPVTLFLIALAPDALRFWLGGDFALNSAPVARALAIGVFLNGLAQVPFSHLQGSGRPDITARIHLMELPLYAGMLFVLAQRMGIRGVALAWLIRVVADSVLMFWFSWRELREDRFVVTRLPYLSLAAVAAFVIATVPNSFGPRIAVAAGICAVAMPLCWFRLLSARERSPLNLMIPGGRRAVAMPVTCEGVGEPQ